MAKSSAHVKIEKIEISSRVRAFKVANLTAPRGKAAVQIDVASGFGVGELERYLQRLQDENAVRWTGGFRFPLFLDP